VLLARQRKANEKGRQHAKKISEEKKRKMGVRLAMPRHSGRQFVAVETPVFKLHLRGHAPETYPRFEWNNWIVLAGGGSINPGLRRIALVSNIVENRCVHRFFVGKRTPRINRASVSVVPVESGVEAMHPFLECVVKIRRC